MSVRSDGGSGIARKSWIRALERTARIEHEPLVTLPLLVERLAERFDGAPALESGERTLSYRDLAALSNRYSRWALAAGLAPGDVVCLLMPNCVEYLAIWLGITRVGATVSLLNSHLFGDVLAHSINIVAPQHVIVSSSLAGALAGARARLPRSTTCWVHGDSPQDLRPILPEIAAVPGCGLAGSERRGVSLDCLALYLYTSGTTGLPKAARVSHHRLMQWSHWFAGLLDTTPEDRMYDCLPLYHSVGGVVATFATLLGGGTVVLRERFSATTFWQDVRDERCTLFQYIGELCRYLVNAAPRVGENQHALRLACGNGLRPEVWVAFQERFRIPRILEYYASTEGNFSLYNCEGEPGAIGRVPAFLAHRLPIALLRTDPQSGEPKRDGSGFCERCAVGEPGEAVGLIPQEDTGRTGQFLGYSDAAASSRKILRNVFTAGDAWYRTGDLMRCDARGFYYFVDRLGDTFRWKGENVSTSEVAGAISGCPGVLEAVVYGVRVPNADGRAGMAAVVVSPAFDVAVFREFLASRLPDYARPVFLRILPVLEATGTFKPLKQALMEAGFDPATLADPLFFDDRLRGAYVSLDRAAYERIAAGTVRL